MAGLFRWGYCPLRAGCALLGSCVVNRGYSMSAVIEIEEINKGGTYRVWHEGELVLKSSSAPILDASRLFVTKGITGRIQMRRRGSDKIDMEGLIAVLATLRISDGYFVRRTPTEGC